MMLSQFTTPSKPVSGIIEIDKFNRLIILSMVLACCLFAGCKRSGPERFHVTGQITYDGEPVEVGAIAFYPIEGTKGPLAGGNVHNGQYDVPASGGPVAGIYRVQIEAMQKPGRQRANMGGELFDELANFLPENYSGIESELRAEISKGQTQFDFHLGNVPSQ